MISAGEPMSFNEESRVITCSFGATSWTPEAGGTEEDLIRVADDALYRAKRQGRNRVVQVPFAKDTDGAPELPQLALPHPGRQ